MSRSKIIKRKIPLAGGESVSEALNNLLGGAKDIGVIYPKYANIATRLESVRDVIRELAKLPIFSAAKWADAREALSKYCDLIDEHLATHFSINLGAYMLDLSQAPKNLQEKIFEQYEEWKSHPITQTLIKTCDSLHQYRDVFDSPSIEFVLNVAGNTWEPLPFIRLNFKELFIDISAFPQGVKISQVIFNIFKILYEHTHEIYDIRISPDIDGDKFTATILECVERLRKMPRLARCQKALNKIVASAELLKARLGNYYRDFVETKDSTIIMQNFVADVSETCSQDDIYMVSEFKQIAQYFAEIQAQNPSKNNPEVSKIFGAVMENINKISEMAPNLQEQREAPAAKPAKAAKTQKKSTSAPANTLAGMSAEEIAKLSPDEIAKLLK